jgi:hypothetical protein
MWKEVNARRWVRSDNAVVIIDESVACSTSRPWLPNYRGWMAFGPGDEEHNYLGFMRKRSLFRIPKKFKTAAAAMRAVDLAYPLRDVA